MIRVAVVDTVVDTVKEKPKFFTPSPKSAVFRIWGKAGMGVKATGNILGLYFYNNFLVPLFTLIAAFFVCFVYFVVNGYCLKNNFISIASQ
jgi:hypothetical protein